MGNTRHHPSTELTTNAHSPTWNTNTATAQNLANSNPEHHKHNDGPLLLPTTPTQRQSHSTT